MPPQPFNREWEHGFDILQEELVNINRHLLTLDEGVEDLRKEGHINNQDVKG